MAAAGSIPTEAGFAVEVKTDCLHVQVFGFYFWFRKKLSLDIESLL